MREIKFRAWDKFNGVMFMGIEGHLDSYKDEAYVLMQFTGLKDRNGKEIYEGDIVASFVNGATEKGDVRWDGIRTGFYIVFPTADVYFPGGPKPEHLQVIGNIYEDPELVK